MRSKPYVSLLLAIGLVIASTAQTKSQEAALLNLPLFPERLLQGGIPLTQALSEIGIHVRKGYVLFGIELHLKDGKEPRVNLNLQPGSTLGDALGQISQQLPGYRFELVSEHMIDVFPVGAKENPHDILNLHVARFDAEDTPSNILVRPTDFIPELKARLEPNARRPLSVLRDVGPGVSLHLRDAILRKILNAVSEATEQLPPPYSAFGWVYSFQPDPNAPTGGLHRWAIHDSVPYGWKQEAEKSRKP